MTKRSTKQAYETPITEALELRFEGNLLGGSDFFLGGAGTYDSESEIYSNGDF